MKYDKNNILLSVTNSYSGKLLKTKDYSGSVVKTKIHDFYNELIWLISHLFLGRILEYSSSPIHMLSSIW